MRFVDLADGGRRLAELLRPRLDDGRIGADALLVAVGTGGRVTGAAVAEALGREVVALATTRSPDGVSVEVTVEVADREVVVVDDGVETGTAAIAVGAALRTAGARRLVLAVPVCPRDAEVALRGTYDDVLAVDRPLVRRSLRWHYDTFA